MTTVDAAQALTPRADGAAPAGVVIRDAAEADMAQVQRIYAYHVLHSTATFEEVPPTVDDMLERRAKVVQQGLPYLVACDGDTVVGYCYANAYRPRVAYRYTIEDSIYLAEGQSGKGLGKLLLAEVIARCEQGPWRQMIAVIAGTNSAGSINLHRSLGFAHVGTQPDTGFKFRQWIDVVFMQRALGPGGSTPPQP